MDRRMSRLVSLTVAMVAAIGTGLAGVLGQDRAAFGLLGLTLLAGLAWGFLSVRLIVVRLNGLQQIRAGQATVLDRIGRLAGTGAAPDRTPELIKTVNQGSKAVTDRVIAVSKQLDHLPYLTVELGRRQQQLITDDLPMPVLGANWGATTPTVLAIIDEILGAAGRRVVLECGSGGSTLWAAASLRLRGDGGQVITLEHDAEYAEVTRATLRAHGLADWVTVVDAPLVDTEFDGGEQPWYDLSGLGEQAPVDLLFVDGPPRPTARLARVPALPLLADRLRSGALIILDDTNRAAEREIIKQWTTPGAVPGMSIRRARQVGRSTMLVATRDV